MKIVLKSAAIVPIFALFVQDCARVIRNSQMHFVLCASNVARLAPPNVANMILLAAKRALRLAKNVRKPVKCKQLRLVLQVLSSKPMINVYLIICGHLSFFSTF